MHRILVVSDSHGLTNTVQNIKERHKADVNIHCGDSELTVDANPLEDFVVVRGNCDWQGDFPREEIVTVGSFRIFVTHGHLYNVKSSLLQLQYRVEEVKADIVLFGHSHIAYSEKHENQLFINPGSIKQPRRWDIRTYAILSLKHNGEVIVHYYDDKGKKIESFPMERVFYF